MTVTLKELARQWWDTDISMEDLVEVYKTLPMPQLSEEDIEKGFFDYENSTDPNKDNTLEAVRSLTDEVFDFSEEEFESFCDEFLSITEQEMRVELDQENAEAHLIARFFTYCLATDEKLHPEVLPVGDFETSPAPDMLIHGYSSEDGSITMTDFHFHCLDSEFLVLFDPQMEMHFYGIVEENGENHPVEVADEQMVHLLYAYLEWRYLALTTMKA